MTDMLSLGVCIITEDGRDMQFLELELDVVGCPSAECGMVSPTIRDPGESQDLVT